MSRRALLIALFASLALNLFIIGAVVGAVALGVRGRAVFAQARPVQSMWAAAETLPPERRDAYRAMLRAETLAVAPKLRAARMTRRGAWTRFAADPFDPQGVTQDLERARALEQQARGQVEARIVAYAAALPPDQRASLGEALQRPIQRHGPRPERR